MSETNEVTIEESSQEQLPELTPEQKEQQEKFWRGFFIKKHSYRLREVHDRMRATKCSVADLVQEVQEKRSPLTRSVRELLLAFQVDFIEQCLDDMYNKPTTL